MGSQANEIKVWLDSNYPLVDITDNAFDENLLNHHRALIEKYFQNYNGTNVTMELLAYVLLNRSDDVQDYVLLCQAYILLMERGLQITEDAVILITNVVSNIFTMMVTNKDVNHNPLKMLVLQTVITKLVQLKYKNVDEIKRLQEIDPLFHAMIVYNMLQLLKFKKADAVNNRIFCEILPHKFHESIGEFVTKLINAIGVPNPDEESRRFWVTMQIRHLSRFEDNILIFPLGKQKLDRLNLKFDVALCEGEAGETFKAYLKSYPVFQHTFIGTNDAVFVAENIVPKDAPYKTCIFKAGLAVCERAAELLSDVEVPQDDLRQAIIENAKAQAGVFREALYTFRTDKMGTASPGSPQNAQYPQQTATTNDKPKNMKPPPAVVNSQFPGVINTNPNRSQQQASNGFKPGGFNPSVQQPMNPRPTFGNSTPPQSDAQTYAQGQVKQQASAFGNVPPVQQAPPVPPVPSVPPVPKKEVYTSTDNAIPRPATFQAPVPYATFTDNSALRNNANYQTYMNANPGDGDAAHYGNASGNTGYGYIGAATGIWGASDVNYTLSTQQCPKGKVPVCGNMWCTPDALHGGRWRHPQYGCVPLNCAAGYSRNEKMHCVKMPTLGYYIDPLSGKTKRVNTNEFLLNGFTVFNKDKDMFQRMALAVFLRENEVNRNKALQQISARYGRMNGYDAFLTAMQRAQQDAVRFLGTSL